MLNIPPVKIEVEYDGTSVRVLDRDTEVILICEKTDDPAQTIHRLVQYILKDHELD